MGKEIFRREKDPGYLFRHDHTPSDLAKANYFYLQNIGYGYFGKKFIMQREGSILKAARVTLITAESIMSWSKAGSC
jgi:hypothetical protein